MTDFEHQDFERQQPGYDQNVEGRRPEQIAREIEETRERMSRDIDALGERLRPRNLAHDAMDSVSTRARQTGSRLVDFVRENPLPVAAVGLGVTWLMTQRSRSTVSGNRMARYAYTGPERRTTDRRIGARIGQVTGQAREAVSNVAETVTERAGALGGSAKSRLRELGASARDRAMDNPLAVAVGALVIGLALGLLLPDTEGENRIMGATRDRLADRAGDVAHRMVDATVDAADQVKETVKAELADRAPQVKEMAQDVARHVMDQTKEAAERVKEQVKNV